MPTMSSYVEGRTDINRLSVSQHCFRAILYNHTSSQYIIFYHPLFTLRVRNFEHVFFNLPSLV